MQIFSYHIVKLSFFEALKAILCPIKKSSIEGLIHAETMTAMVLGSSIYSSTRLFSKEIIVFVQWQDEQSLERFLTENRFGNVLRKAWYLKLNLTRKWGTNTGFELEDHIETEESDLKPIVAITLARMKYTQIPRFLSWGRPVEKLVRDHPASTLSLASIRYPNLISTFSIWKTTKEMEEMVKGHSKVPQPKRHIDAMKENNRKNFHYEFCTLRFQITEENGQWRGISDYSKSTN